MAQRPTKAASNVYCQARMRAAEYNDAFKSREGAAPAIGCDKDTLAKYELGILRVPCDVVVMMADAYHAPELLTRYCAEECPIGIGCGAGAGPQPGAGHPARDQLHKEHPGGE